METQIQYGRYSGDISLDVYRLIRSRILKEREIEKCQRKKRK